MKPKSTLILDNEFIQYCELNKIDNIDKLAKEATDKLVAVPVEGVTVVE